MATLCLEFPHPGGKLSVDSVTYAIAIGSLGMNWLYAGANKVHLMTNHMFVTTSDPGKLESKVQEGFASGEILEYRIQSTGVCLKVRSGAVASLR